MWMPPCSDSAFSEAAFSAAISAWCAGCHTRIYDSGGGMGLDPTFAHRTAIHDGPCTQCHVAHGSNASMTGWSAANEDPGGAALEPGAPGYGDSRLLKVDDRDIGRLVVGQRGELVLSSLPGQAMAFTVRSITPVSAQQDGRNVFRVEAQLDAGNLARLRPGMEGVNRMILSRVGSDVEMIPEIAKHLIESGGKRLRPMLTLATAGLFPYLSHMTDIALEQRQQIIPHPQWQLRQKRREADRQISHRIRP